MDEKKMRKLWGTSLIVIGILSIFIGAVSLADIAVGDWVKRLIGITDLIMLVILTYTSVKIFRKR